MDRGRRSLADDNIQGKVLHRRIEHLLHAAVEAVDLINKEYVVLAQISKQSSQIARFFNSRAGGDPDIHIHLVGDDGGKGGLAQSRRAIEQHMVEVLAPHFGSLDIDAQVLLGLVLTDVFRQRPGTQGKFCLRIGAGIFRSDNAVFKIHVKSVQIPASSAVLPVTDSGRAS